jgi:hypothetical protein
VIARVPYFSYCAALQLYESLGWWQNTDLTKVSRRLRSRLRSASPSPHHDAFTATAFNPPESIRDSRCILRRLTRSSTT